MKVNKLFKIPSNKPYVWAIYAYSALFLEIITNALRILPSQNGFVNFPCLDHCLMTLSPAPNPVIVVVLRTLEIASSILLLVQLAYNLWNITKTKQKCNVQRTRLNILLVILIPVIYLIITLIISNFFGIQSSPLSPPTP